MGKYASKTDVTVSRSKAEIEQLLTLYGCTGFMSAWGALGSTIAFQANGRQVRFFLPEPSRNDPEITMTSSGRDRTDSQIETAFKQAQKQRWRALLLAIKAKLEAVECGIVTFDQEFLAHIVGPDGQTVGETLIPAIEAGESELPKLGFKA